MDEQQILNWISICAKLIRWKRRLPSCQIFFYFASIISDLKKANTSRTANTIFPFDSVIFNVLYLLHSIQVHPHKAYPLNSSYFQSYNQIYIQATVYCNINTVSMPGATVWWLKLVFDECNLMFKIPVVCNPMHQKSVSNNHYTKCSVWLFVCTVFTNQLLEW